MSEVPKKKYFFLQSLGTRNSLSHNRFTRAKGCIFAGAHLFSHLHSTDNQRITTSTQPQKTFAHTTAALKRFIGPAFL